MKFGNLDILIQPKQRTNPAKSLVQAISGLVGHDVRGHVVHQSLKKPHSHLPILSAHLTQHLDTIGDVSRMEPVTQRTVERRVRMRLAERDDPALPRGLHLFVQETIQRSGARTTHKGRPGKSRAPGSAKGSLQIGLSRDVQKTSDLLLSLGRREFGMGLLIAADQSAHPGDPEETLAVHLGRECCLRQTHEDPTVGGKVSQYEGAPFVRGGGAYLKTGGVVSLHLEVGLVGHGSEMKGADPVRTRLASDVAVEELGVRATTSGDKKT